MGNDDDVRCVAWSLIAKWAYSEWRIMRKCVNSPLLYLYIWETRQCQTNYRIIFRHMQWKPLKSIEWVWKNTTRIIDNWLEIFLQRHRWWSMRYGNVLGAHSPIKLYYIVLSFRCWWRPNHITKAIKWIFAEH